MVPQSSATKKRHPSATLTRLSRRRPPAARGFFYAASTFSLAAGLAKSRARVMARSACAVRAKVRRWCPPVQELVLIQIHLAV